MGASREKKSTRLKATAGRMRGVLDVGALDANQRAPSFIVGTAVMAGSAKVMLKTAKALGLLEKCGFVF